MDGNASGVANPDEMRQSPQRVLYTAQSIRLLKARLAAGFESGKAASEAHGWAVGTYVGHENGRRSIRPEVAARYAEAYAVPVDWLLGAADPTGERAAVERAQRLEALDVDAVPHAFETVGVEAMGLVGAPRRLAQARRDGGFTSVPAAARHLGIPASTCYAHENGRNNIGARAAHLYGRAYGADEAWILNGSFRPVAGRERPTGGPRADPGEIARLAAALRGGTDPRTGGFPRLPDDAALLLLDGCTGRPSGPYVVARVAAANDGDDAGPGDKVVIDLDAGGVAGLYARTIPGGVRLDRLDDPAQAGGDVIGRVLLVLKAR